MYFQFRRNSYTAKLKVLSAEWVPQIEHYYVLTIVNGLIRRALLCTSRFGAARVTSKKFRGVSSVNYVLECSTQCAIRFGVDDVSQSDGIFVR